MGAGADRVAAQRAGQESARPRLAERRPRGVSHAGHRAVGAAGGASAARLLPRACAAGHDAAGRLWPGGLGTVRRAGRHAAGRAVAALAAGRADQRPAAGRDGPVSDCGAVCQRPGRRLGASLGIGLVLPGRLRRRVAAPSRALWGPACADQGASGRRRGAACPARAAGHRRGAGAGPDAGRRDDPARRALAGPAGRRRILPPDRPERLVPRAASAGDGRAGRLRPARALGRVRLRRRTGGRDGGRAGLCPERGAGPQAVPHRRARHRRAACDDHRRRLGGDLAGRPPLGRCVA